MTDFMKQQQKLTTMTIPLSIIREDLTHGDWVKSCALSVKKLSIQIKEKITGDVFRVRLEWFNHGCKANLYAHLVNLIAARLKCKSLNNIYASDHMIKQNMVIQYLDDEGDDVTISSWSELAHACCIIGGNPLKLEVGFSGAFKKKMELIKGIITGDATNIRVATLSRSGAKIHCGKHNIFTLNSNGVGILYFKNNTDPLWRVYSNPKKASDFVYSQPQVRTYLFIHDAGRKPSIFARHYPKGVDAIQHERGSAWPYYHIVEMDELPEAWSADEKKCGKGNVRLAFLTPADYKAFDTNGSCDYRVVLETKSRSFD